MTAGNKIQNFPNSGPRLVEKWGEDFNRWIGELKDEKKGEVQLNYTTTTSSSSSKLKSCKGVVRPNSSHGRMNTVIRIAKVFFTLSYETL